VEEMAGAERARDLKAKVVELMPIE